MDFWRGSLERSPREMNLGNICSCYILLAGLYQVSACFFSFGLRGLELRALTRCGGETRLEAIGRQVA